MLMMIYVETGDHIGGVVYKVKLIGPSVELCGTPYESVTLSKKMSLFFTDWCLFFK